LVEEQRDLEALPARKAALMPEMEDALDQGEPITLLSAAVKVGKDIFLGPTHVDIRDANKVGKK